MAGQLGWGHRKGGYPPDPMHLGVALCSASFATHSIALPLCIAEDRHAEPEDEEEERGRPKQSNQHCFKCGKHGHTSKQCPIGTPPQRGQRVDVGQSSALRPALSWRGVSMRRME